MSLGVPKAGNTDIKRTQLEAQWYSTNSYVCIGCLFEAYWFIFLFLNYGKHATILSMLVSNHSPNMCLPVCVINTLAHQWCYYLPPPVRFFSLFIVSFRFFSSVNHISHIYVTEGSIKKAICPNYKHFVSFIHLDDSGPFVCSIVSKK